MTSTQLATPEIHQFPLTPELIDIDMIRLAERARDRFMGELATTDLEYSPVLSYGDNEVYIKRVDKLPGGNFKYLSAMTAVADLLESGHIEFTLATAGSYGMGVGHAVKTYGGIVTAFMPEGSNPSKRVAMEKMGVDVREYGDNFDESLEEARRFAAARDITLLHPFANLSNFAGTGIIGLELLNQVPEMTHFVGPFGGGSLICGTGGVIKQERPDVELVVAQAAACDPFLRSVESGRTEEVVDPMRFGQSFFKSLGGVGVGKTDPMTLGLGSSLMNKAQRVGIDDVLGTMYDFEQGHGVLPEAAAGHSLEAARQLARTPSLEGATIVTPLTGSNPDEYKEGYLLAMSRRRAEKYGE